MYVKLVLHGLIERSLKCNYGNYGHARLMIETGETNKRI